MIAVLAVVRMDDVKKFVAKLFDRVDVTILSHGDVNLNNTMARSRILDNLLKNSMFIAEINQPIIRKLDSTKRYLRSLGTAHSDSALAVYFQAMIHELPAHLLEPYFYNQLRAVNRVGYRVHAGALTIDQTPWLLFSV